MKELDTTSDFLFYQDGSGKISVQVIIGEQTVWATQKGISDIFDTSRENITMHLNNIFKDSELNQDTVCKEILHTATDNKKYNTRFYSLDAIIAVGYRVNSYKATKFRQWATKILNEYLIKGFALDDERLKQGNNLFNKDFFKELLERIKSIRASEKMFYEKVKELYATSVDYDKNDPATATFFSTVQNKLEYAVIGKTSAEIIKDRANAELPNMNLKTWKNVGKEGRIQKSDVTVAKNYLEEPELRTLNSLVNMFLEYAELQAEKNKLMKMKDWIDRLDRFLLFNEYDVLKNVGKMQKDVADKFAEGEYSKYKVIQDRNFNNDFNKVVSQIRSTNTIPIEITISEKKNMNDFDQYLKGLLKVPPPNKDK